MVYFFKSLKSSNFEMNNDRALKLYTLCLLGIYYGHSAFTLNIYIVLKSGHLNKPPRCF